jgi:hypothetical protein
VIFHKCQSFVPLSLVSSTLVICTMVPISVFLIFYWYVPRVDFSCSFPL